MEREVYQKNLNTHIPFKILRVLWLLFRKTKKYTQKKSKKRSEVLQ